MRYKVIITWYKNKKRNCRKKIFFDLKQKPDLYFVLPAFNEPGGGEFTRCTCNASKWFTPTTEAVAGRGFEHFAVETFR